MLWQASRPNRARQIQELRRDGDARLTEQYQEILLNTEGLTTVEVSAAIAEKAARLRSQYSLRTPDAIQIATALHTVRKDSGTLPEPFLRLQALL